MKKSFIYFGAALLLSSMALVGCNNKKNTSDVEDQNDKVSYNGEVVKTQFAISMPEQAVKRSSARRMPGNIVQKDGLNDFQGMTQIMLVPFAKEGAITGTDSPLGAKIDISTTGGNVVASDFSGKQNNAKVYSDVSIPLTTASFLFYGKSAATDVNLFMTGVLDATYADNAAPSTYRFALRQLLTDAAGVTGTGNGATLLTYLNSIAATEDENNKKWYEYTVGTDNEGMARLFAIFSTMHGLSSFEVSRVLTDLYRSMAPLASSTTLAANIRTAINNATYAEIQTVGTRDTVVLVEALRHFPAQYNLPDGSVDIVWNATNHRFESGNYSNMIALDRYTYPAELWYYTNSRIVTSNTSKKTAYENTTNVWSDIVALHTDGTAVNTRTRAVAIQNVIQYAVARFDVAVKLKETSLADNSETAEGIATNVDCSAGFPVTGILIGGQKTVGYDFVPVETTEFTIYDNVMTSNALATPVEMRATTSLSQYNSTLVLQSNNDKVRIAVEMVNDAKDFYGYQDMLIPHGGKFYVVAELDAAAATTTDKQVFLQDYTTTANLTLKDLKKAYSTIPDLRTPQLELGFSVDLNWTAGTVYNVDFE